MRIGETIAEYLLQRATKCQLDAKWGFLNYPKGGLGYAFAELSKAQGDLWYSLALEMVPELVSDSTAEVENG